MEELQMIWGWQPALYLFLGGMGAGAFTFSAILYLRDRRTDARALNIAMWAALACLAVGLLLLLTELITPLRGMMMWQSFSNFTSWMTYGAWLIFAAAAVFFAVCMLTCEPVQAWCRKRSSTVSAKNPDGGQAALPRDWPATRALAIVGIALGAGVAVYTGLLLMSAPGVPLWGTPLLPCVFTASAFDTGVGLVEVVMAVSAKFSSDADPTALAAHERNERFLRMAVVALVILEAAALVALLGIMLSGGGARRGSSFAIVAASSAAMLVAGQLAPLFWGLVVLTGLVLPFGAAIAGLVGKKAIPAFSLAGAIGAMVGGCALRFLVLMAGLHVDYVLDAVGMLPLL